MNDRKQLGIIRISAHGTLFEVPYFEEADFARTVVAVRAHQGYEPAQSGVFIPYHAIDWMARVPSGSRETVEDLTGSGAFGRGATRQ